MNGRLEKELIAEQKMEQKLKNLPQIFSEFYYSQRAAKKSYSTLNTYISYLINFANFVTNNNINNNFYMSVTANDIERYLISLETREVGGKIVRTGDSIQAVKYSAINTFFDWLANKRELIDKNPVLKISRPKVNTENKVIYLTKAEIAKVKKELYKSTDNNAVRDRTLFLLGIGTGMRVSALMNLNVEDINFEASTLTTIEKGNKTRTIDIGENLLYVLKEYVQWRTDNFHNIDTSALFLSQKKHRLSTDAANDMIAKYTKCISGKKITMHKLRSSMITNLALADVPIEVLQRIAGHSSPSITMKYRAIEQQEKKNAIGIMDKMI